MYPATKVCIRQLKYVKYLTEEFSFYQQIYLNLGKKLIKCYILGIDLYGAETWTLRKVDKTNLGSCEMCWRGM